MDEGGRNGKTIATFNVSVYIENNEDIRINSGITETDYREHYMHYINDGYKENRVVV